MLKLLLFVSTALVLASCTREPSPPPTGAVLYQQYCASCHGPTGKGNGPVAASLQQI
ncbi:MAG: cytochrome c [Deltaproteobacteria bacterium]|nr:cytochrome c [Deltaproteobacteria bacterium]